MVAQSQIIELPNVRKLFIPDPGYTIGECDLSGADAQVVAWEANDAELKAAFRAGVKIHIKNARDMFPEIVKGWSDEALKNTDRPGGIYYACKRGIHATNYIGTAKNIAGRIGWTVIDTERFQKRWLGLHSGIGEWHKRVKAGLEGRIAGQPARSVYNKWGYRIIFYDRISTMLPEAVAWGPQSTVGINCSKGAISVRGLVQVLLQVHDSFIFQFKTGTESVVVPELYRRLHGVVVPYEDPLTIPWKLALGTRSWGEAEELKWSKFLEPQPHQ